MLSEEFNTDMRGLIITGRTNLSRLVGIESGVLVEDFDERITVVLLAGQFLHRLYQTANILCTLEYTVL